MSLVLFSDRGQIHTGCHVVGGHLTHFHACNNIHVALCVGNKTITKERNVMNMSTNNTENKSN